MFVKKKKKKTELNVYKLKNVPLKLEKCKKNTKFVKKICFNWIVEESP